MAHRILRFIIGSPDVSAGGCLLTKALEAVNWKSYGLEQPAEYQRDPHGIDSPGFY